MKWIGDDIIYLEVKSKEFANKLSRLNKIKRDIVEKQNSGRRKKTT